MTSQAIAALVHVLQHVGRTEVLLAGLFFLGVYGGIILETLKRRWERKERV